MTEEAKPCTEAGLEHLLREMWDKHSIQPTTVYWPDGVYYYPARVTIHWDRSGWTLGTKGDK